MLQVLLFVVQEGSDSVFSVLCYHWTVGVKPAANESSLHLFSIGYEALVLEAWADTDAGMWLQLAVAKAPKMSVVAV